MIKYYKFVVENQNKNSWIYLYKFIDEKIYTWKLGKWAELSLHKAYYKLIKDKELLEITEEEMFIEML